MQICIIYYLWNHGRRNVSSRIGFTCTSTGLSVRGVVIRSDIPKDISLNFHRFVLLNCFQLFITAQFCESRKCFCEVHSWWYLHSAMFQILDCADCQCHSQHSCKDFWFGLNAKKWLYSVASFFTLQSFIHCLLFLDWMALTPGNGFIVTSIYFCDAIPCLLNC